MSKCACGLLALVCGAAALLVFAAAPATAWAQGSPFQMPPARYVWVGPGSGLPPADLAVIRDRVTDLFGSLPEVVVAPPTEPERHAIVSSRMLDRHLIQIEWSASLIPNGRGWDTEVRIAVTSTAPPAAVPLLVRQIFVGGGPPMPRQRRLENIGSSIVTSIVNWHDGELGFPTTLGS